MRNRLGWLGLVCAAMSVGAQVVLWCPTLVAPDFKRTWWMLGVLFAVPAFGVWGLVLSLVGRTAQSGQLGLLVCLASLLGFAAWVLTNCSGWG